VPISGTLLVTTPQDVAVTDVDKALAMFRRMSVPILGIVENMGTFVCSHCGEVTEVFGRGGGERFAQRHEVEYFGSIPLDVRVRQGGDAGVPAVAQRDPGAAAEVLRTLARTVAARVSVRAARQAPVLSIS
jgi:ATP-binding protein involved in chromosome partitioning